MYFRRSLTVIQRFRRMRMSWKIRADCLHGWIGSVCHHDSPNTPPCYDQLTLYLSLTQNLHPVRLSIQFQCRVSTVQWRLNLRGFQHVGVLCYESYHLMLDWTQLWPWRKVLPPRVLIRLPHIIICLEIPPELCLPRLKSPSLLSHPQHSIMCCLAIELWWKKNLPVWGHLWITLPDLPNQSILCLLPLYHLLMRSALGIICCRQNLPVNCSDQCRQWLWHQTWRWRLVQVWQVL